MFVLQGTTEMSHKVDDINHCDSPPPAGHNSLLAFVSPPCKSPCHWVGNDLYKCELNKKMSLFFAFDALVMSRWHALDEAEGKYLDQKQRF